MNNKTIITFGLIFALALFSISLSFTGSSNNDRGQKQLTTSKYKDKKTYERYKDNYLTEPEWEADADKMVLVQPNSPELKPFLIDAYEAVIADRTAYSIAGQTPTTKLRYDEAKEACKKAGKRMCTIKQWQTACRGGRTTYAVFPDPEYLAKNCDFARSQGYDANDYPGKTDSHPQCHINGIYHMIGNLSEFAQDEEGNVAVLGLTYYDAKMRNKNRALEKACERIVIGAGKYPANKHNEGMGFRCCIEAK